MCIMCDITSAQAAYEAAQEGQLTYMLAQMMAEDTDENVRSCAAEWLEKNAGSRAIELGLTADNLVKRLRLIAEQTGPVMLGKSKKATAYPYVILTVSLFGPSDEHVLMGLPITAAAYKAVTAKLQQEGMKWADVSDARQQANAAMQKAFDSVTDGTRH